MMCQPPCKEKMLEAPMGAGEARINLPMGRIQKHPGSAAGSSRGWQQAAQRDLAVSPSTRDAFWGTLRSEGLLRTSLVPLIIY